MSEEKTHWRSMDDNNFLGHWDFKPGEKKELTIKQVDKKTVFNIKKQENNDVTTISFEQDYLPMILNKINRKSITIALGTPFIEEWVGRSIVLFTVKGKFFGEETYAIRVSTEAPKKEAAKPKEKKLITLMTGTPEWEKVTKFVSENEAKEFDGVLKQLSGKYKISGALKTKLIEIHEG